MDLFAGHGGSPYVDYLVVDQQMGVALAAHVPTRHENEPVVVRPRRPVERRVDARGVGVDRLAREGHSLRAGADESDAGTVERFTSGTSPRGAHQQDDALVLDDTNAAIVPKPRLQVRN
jgi:hypothetical protein